MVLLFDIPLAELLLITGIMYFV